METKVTTEPQISLDNNELNVVVQRPKYKEGGITGKGFKKGQSGNPKGRPKGIPSVKEEIAKIIKKGEITKVARNIIEGAIQGDDKKQDKFLQMSGDLQPTNNSATVNVLNQTIEIDNEVLMAARQLWKDQQQNKIIDI